MTRRITSMASLAVFAAALSTLCIAGCGGDNQSTENPTAAATNATPKSPAAKSPSAKTDAGKTQPPSPSTKLTSPPLVPGVAASAELLMQPEDLAPRLDDQSLTILDARGWNRYNEGHVPGAWPVPHLRWKDQSLRPGGLADARFWSHEVGDLDVRPDTPVVVYADTLPDAARVWWLLRYVGLKRVAILDGGWPLWKRKNLPTEKLPRARGVGKFTPNFQADRLLEIADVKNVLAAKDPSVVIVDARSADEYSGRDVRGPRGGHLPGAVLLSWNDLVNDDGRLIARDELRSLLSRRGLSPQSTVVTHCQTGSRAAVVTFALELAGYPQVKNFYRGWSQWSSDPAAPVENPAAAKQ